MMRTAAKILVICSVVIIAAAVPSFAQTVKLKGGYGVLINRDSAIVWSLDPAKYKAIGDSLGYVNTQRLSDSLDANPRGAGSGITTGQLTDSLNKLPRAIPYDSLRRVGREYSYTAHAAWSIDTDTSNIRLFGMTGGMGSTIQEMMFQTNRTLVLQSISITMARDSSLAGFYIGKRDTLIQCLPDSIPAGYQCAMAYIPVSVSAINGTGMQVLRLYIMAKDAKTGTYSDERWQIPLILGSVMKYRGAYPDTYIRVTLNLVEKVPGLIY